MADSNPEEVKTVGVDVDVTAPLEEGAPGHRDDDPKRDLTQKMKQLEAKLVPYLIVRAPLGPDEYNARKQVNDRKKELLTDKAGAMALRQDIGKRVCLSPPSSAVDSDSEPEWSEYELESESDSEDFDFDDDRPIIDVLWIQEKLDKKFYAPLTPASSGASHCHDSPSDLTDFEEYSENMQQAPAAVVNMEPVGQDQGQADEEQNVVPIAGAVIDGGLESKPTLEANGSEMEDKKALAAISATLSAATLPGVDDSGSRPCPASPPLLPWVGPPCCVECGRKLDNLLELSKHMMSCRGCGVTEMGIKGKTRKYKQKPRIPPKTAKSKIRLTVTSKAKAATGGGRRGRKRKSTGNKFKKPSASIKKAPKKLKTVDRVTFTKKN